MAFSSLWEVPGLTQVGIASSGVGVAGIEAISVLLGQGLEPRCSWLAGQCSAQKENHIFCKCEVALGFPGLKHCSQRGESLLAGVTGTGREFCMD